MTIDLEKPNIVRTAGAVPSPRLALIAHDGKKVDLLAFATYNRSRLQKCRLVATRSTGRLLIEKVGLVVDCLESGPLGGDAQIANRVVEHQIDAVIFIVDPLVEVPAQIWHRVRRHS